MNYYIDIAALIVALFAVYRGMRTQRYDEKAARAASSKATGDAAMTFEELANRAAERALGLQDQIDVLTKKVDDQETKIRLLECENADLRDWAEALVHQVKSFHGTPVEMRQRTPPTNCEGTKP